MDKPKKEPLCEARKKPPSRRDEIQDNFLNLAEFSQEDDDPDYWENGKEYYIDKMTGKVTEVEVDE